MNKQLLEQEYIKNNKGIKPICRTYNITERHLKQLLHQYNIPLKPRGGYQRFFHNDHYFKKWSHNMAYITGFISADGHIRKNSPDLEIGLHPKDINILNFIRDEISPKSMVHYRDNNCVRLLIKSQTIVDDLNKYSINNNKTKNLHISFKIPNKYWGDYLRGFFDGDGSVYLVQDKQYKTKFKQYIWSEIPCASQQFLIDIQKKLGFGYIRNKQNYYSLDFRHHNSLKLRDILYKNDGFCLKRKRDIFYVNV